MFRSLAAVLSAALLAALVVLALPASPGAGRAAAAPGPEKKGGAPSKKDSDLRAEDELRKTSRKVADRCGEKLGPVIKLAVEKGLKEEASSVLATLKKSAPDYKKLGELAKLVEGCTPAADATKAEADKKEFQKRLETAYDGHAKGLFEIANKCFKLGMYARAFDLVNEVVDFDPDNREARKILGWVRDPGDSKKWIAKYELDVMKTGGSLKIDGQPTEKTAHVLWINEEGKPEGWIPKKDLPQWQKGMRPFARGWLPKDQEAEKRRTNEYRAWEVESEHFLIKTNVGRDAAYEFGWVLLEDYYTAFLRHYFGFFESPEAGAQLLFDVKAKNQAPKKHIVFLYQSRNHYLQHVKAEHGNTKLLLESAGFYSGAGDHCSHFFMTEDREDTLATLYHEVAHQLFEETKADAGGGSRGNNWVIEGTASYMETWEKVDGKWKAGVRTNIQRIQRVKELFAAGQSFDLAGFIAIDNKDFHASNRGDNYAWACALSYFLMHYDDERYKEDFVQFIRAFYEGKVVEDSLAEYINVEGVSDRKKRLDTLAKQFKEYMGSL